MNYQEQITQNQTVDDNIEERLATHDLFDTAAANADCQQFVWAITVAGLESTLRGPDLLTLFVPSTMPSSARAPISPARPISRGWRTRCGITSYRARSHSRRSPPGKC